MTEINDGGPAFPTNEQRDGHYSFPGSPGMSLRDWLAGQAITGLAAYEADQYADFASAAYRLADAMLRARDPDYIPNASNPIPLRDK